MELDNTMAVRGQLNILDPSSTVFAVSPGGYLSMTCGGQTYDRVRLCRALPYYEPEKYICVCNPEDGAEYGMIADLTQLSPEQKALISAELDKIYYTPVVTAVKSAKMKMGFMEFEVQTETGVKFFRMRDPNKNIRYLTPGIDRRVQLTDCDGNRYLIPDAEKLDRKSFAKIETYLV